MQHMVPTKAKIAGLLFTLALFAPVRAADLMTGLAAYERQDYQTALVQLMQLAEAGEADAQFILGRMFGGGEGVLQDYVEAHKWYNLAASRGQRMAAPARDAIAQQMTPEQIARAQELAREWRPLGGAADLRTPPESAAQTSLAADPAFATLPATAASTDTESDTVIAETEVPALAAESPVAVLGQEPDQASEEPSETLIASIQLELKRLGYPIRLVDGKLGGETLEAIRSYQSSQGMEASGQASQHLLRHMQAQQGTEPRIQRAPPAQIRERPLADWQRLL